MDLVLRCDVKKNDENFMHSVVVYHGVDSHVDYLKGKMAKAVAHLESLKTGVKEGEDSFSVSLAADGVADMKTWHGLSTSQFHDLEDALADLQKEMVAESRAVKAGKGK